MIEIYEQKQLAYLWPAGTIQSIVKRNWKAALLSQNVISGIFRAFASQESKFISLSLVT